MHEFRALRAFGVTSAEYRGTSKAGSVGSPGDCALLWLGCRGRRWLFRVGLAKQAPVVSSAELTLVVYRGVD